MSELFHYGTPRHSGRYPWGSGKDPYQRDHSFLSQYRELHASGKSEVEIAKALGMTTGELRKKKSAETEAERAANISRANRLKEKGYSNIKIGELMGANESTVRSWLKVKEASTSQKVKNVADILESNLTKKGGFIDIGSGSELDPQLMGVSKDRLNAAVDVLKERGYEVIQIHAEQTSTPGQYTTIKVLAPAGTTKKDVWDNIDDIHTLTEFSPNGGKDIFKTEYPESISSKRILIRYGDEGGAEKDGTIELRRGVDDISLGNSSYAQVRIAVDGTHYMKGMAFYSNDIPKGYDVIYNTNKKSGTAPTDVFKALKVDKRTGEIDIENPFGAVIKAGGQSKWTDENGKEHLRVINKLKEEGDWDHYKKSLSSQFLSKQPLQLIKNQLDISYSSKKEEFEKIMSLTNPVLKAKLLKEFADNCDSSAVHLDAASLPRQSSKVILPVPSLKDNEIYAPTYKNGEKVVLIRYPHGGTFEIPELVVNNKHKEARDLLKDASDAVGINSKVAQRLSGADFDGDTVVVIPVNSRVRVKTSAPLKGLIGFDPSDAYPGYPDMKVIKSKTKQSEMGIVSNLISDMTLHGATSDELARAVKYSMVVIDSEKHKLNYKLAREECGVAALHKKYQGKEQGGASTLISKAKSEIRIDEVKRSYKPNKDGEYEYTKTGRTYKKYAKNSDGSYKLDINGEPVYKELPKKTKMAKMLYYKDANALSSGTPQEKIYANYANKLKALANTSRKEYMNIKMPAADPTAKKIFSKEVDSLNAKLDIALSNAPKERNAQARAAARLNKLLKENPEIKSDPDQLKKARTQAIAKARVEVGAKKQAIDISDDEWKAIQSNAISPTKLSRILDNTDNEKLKERAMPRTQTAGLTNAQMIKIKAMSNAGWTVGEIAESMGLSASTITKYKNE